MLPVVTITLVTGFLYFHLSAEKDMRVKTLLKICRGQTNSQFLQFCFKYFSYCFKHQNQKKIPKLSLTTRISGIHGNLHCPFDFDSLSFRSVFYTPSLLCFPLKLLLAMRNRSAMRKEMTVIYIHRFLKGYIARVANLFYAKYHLQKRRRLIALKK